MLQLILIEEISLPTPVSIPVQSHLDVHVGGTEDGEHFVVFLHRHTAEPLVHLCRDPNGTGWVALLAPDWTPALRAAELSELLTMTRAVI